MLKSWINGSRMLPPWLALAILLGIQLVSIPFLLKLHFNNAPDIYSPSDSPTIQLRESLFKEFPSDEAVIALFEGDGLYTPAFLAALDRAAKTLAALPAVDRVLTLTTVEHIDATYDGFAVSLLIDAVVFGRRPEGTVLAGIALLLGSGALLVDDARRAQRALQV